MLENGLVEILKDSLLRFHLFLLSRILTRRRNAMTLRVALHLVSASSNATLLVDGARLAPLIWILRNRFLSLHLGKEVNLNFIRLQIWYYNSNY